MSNVPAPEKREYITTEDGYKVVSDYGKLGSCTVTVHVPPRDPEAAARNRKTLNAVLARYGYKLKEKEVGEKPAPDENEAG